MTIATSQIPAQTVSDFDLRHRATITSVTQRYASRLGGEKARRAECAGKTGIRRNLNNPYSVLG